MTTVSPARESPPASSVAVASRAVLPVDDVIDTEAERAEFRDLVDRGLANALALKRVQEIAAAVVAIPGVLLLPVEWVWWQFPLLYLIAFVISTALMRLVFLPVHLVQQQMLAARCLAAEMPVKAVRERVAAEFAARTRASAQR